MHYVAWRAQIYHLKLHICGLHEHRFQKKHVRDPLGKSMTCCCLSCLSNTRENQDRDKTLGQCQKERKRGRTLPDMYLCHPCHLGIHFLFNPDPFQNFIFLCRFFCRRLAPRDPRFIDLLLLSNVHHHLSPPSQFASERSCQSSCFVAVGTVPTLPMMFSNRHSSESAVQQALRHQCLDCEHLFLVSDCAESVLEFVRLVDERPQDVVELFDVFGSVSFRDVADQCCIFRLRARHVRLIVSHYSRVPRLESHLSFCCTVISGSFAAVLCNTW